MLSEPTHTQSIVRSLLNGSRSVQFILGGKSDLDPYQFTLNSNGDLDQISDLDQFTLPITFLIYDNMITLSFVIMHIPGPLKSGWQSWHGRAVICLTLIPDEIGHKH